MIGKRGRAQRRLSAAAATRATPGEDLDNHEQDDDDEQDAQADQPGRRRQSDARAGRPCVAVAARVHRRRERVRGPRERGLRVDDGRPRRAGRYRARCR